MTTPNTDEFRKSLEADILKSPGPYNNGTFVADWCAKFLKRALQFAEDLERNASKHNARMQYEIDLAKLQRDTQHARRELAEAKIEQKELSLEKANKAYDRLYSQFCEAHSIVTACQKVGIGMMDAELIHRLSAYGKAKK